MRGAALRGEMERAWSFVFVGAMLVLSLFPVYWVLTISLKERLAAFAMPPLWIFAPTFEHYHKLWEHDLFRSSFVNSLVITAVGVLLAMALAVPAAYALTRLRVRGGHWIRLWLLLAYMLPEFLFVIPMFTFYQWTGLYDTHVGLALLYQVHALPLSIWLLSSFFREIDPAIDEAALIEGCGHWRILTRIYVPCALPGLSATAILNAIWIWNELAIALGLTFSKAQPITVGVTSFRGYTSLDWGAMSAASIVAIVPMLLFAVAAQKHIVKGMTLGAVKG